MPSSLFKASLPPGLEWHAWVAHTTLLKYQPCLSIHSGNLNWSPSYPTATYFVPSSPSAPSDCEELCSTDRREPSEKLHDDVVSGVQSLMDGERRAAGVIRKPRVDFHCVFVAGSICRGRAALVIASVFW
ncbi:hypothetical protein JTB14_014859 [Gonioctena quinquepunctata]|nr:hypothetical protein JTB14_014859 [Gonioctena quinquepunctata]